MKLKPIDTSTFKLVAEWMTRKENYQWLDFGNGHQILSPVSLKIMTQRDIHLLRVFTLRIGRCADWPGGTKQYFT
jgi:hypothetical protein